MTSNLPPNMSPQDPIFTTPPCPVCDKEECTVECDCVECIDELARTLT